MSSTPKVSIGLAVYNGELYLRRAIESILDQTFRDFELIISDDASTDATEQISRDCAARDSRIRYCRNGTTVGRARNQSRTLELALGEYFRWVAHDDFLAPTLLAECVRVLDADREVALCYSQVKRVDDVAGTIRCVPRSRASTPDPVRRLAGIALGPDFMEETYGLMRRDLIISLAPPRDYVGSGRPFLAALALRGRFVEIDKPLFNKRTHAANPCIDRRPRPAWFDPSASGRRSFPWWAQFADLVTRVSRADVSGRIRLRCMAVVLWWTVTRAPNLAEDIVIAASRSGRGRRWRSTRRREAANWA